MNSSQRDYSHDEDRLAVPEDYFLTRSKRNVEDSLRVPGIKYTLKTHRHRTSVSAR